MVGPSESSGTMTPDRAATQGQIQAAWRGLVVPVAPGLGPSAAVDPDATETPVADALAKIDDVGDERGLGAVLLPPTTVQEAAPLVPSQFVRFLGWGINTSQIEFTDLRRDGIRVTTLKDAQHTYFDGFTLSGADRGRRQGGSAIHFDHDTAHPKQFNIGTLGFRNWVDPVVHMERGAPFGCTWSHLDFGFGNNDGREIVLEENQGMLGSRIQYISAGNSTNDVVFSTNYAGARLFIGFLNIGGSAGQAINVKSTPVGHIAIGGVNFESGVALQRPIVSVVGPASFRVDYVQNGNTQMASFVRLGEQNGNNVIGHLSTLRSAGARVSGKKVVVDDQPAAPSFYFGELADIAHNAQQSRHKVWALGDMRASDGTRANAGQADRLAGPTSRSPDRLGRGELAVEDSADADAPSLVYRDDDDELHYWDPTG